MKVVCYCRVSTALRAAGHNLRAIAATLTAEGFQTKKGGKWHHDTVNAILSRVTE